MPVLGAREVGQLAVARTRHRRRHRTDVVMGGCMICAEPCGYRRKSGSNPRSGGTELGKGSSPRSGDTGVGKGKSLVRSWICHKEFGDQHCECSTQTQLLVWYGRSISYHGNPGMRQLEKRRSTTRLEPPMSGRSCGHSGTPQAACRVLVHPSETPALMDRYWPLTMRIWRQMSHECLAHDTLDQKPSSRSPISTRRAAQ